MALEKRARGLFASGHGTQIPVLFLFVASLCVVSFYMGAAFCGRSFEALPSTGGVAGKEAFGVPAGSSEALAAKMMEPLTQVDIPKFGECNITLQDHTPCTDPNRWKKYERQRLAFRERHCPPKAERLQCLVPPPEGYKLPIRWPASRDQCWYKNVPFDWINNEKANQNWLRKEGDKFVFPGGGTMFPDGVDEYIDQMEELVPGMKDGSVRTALDTGCGVASWGGYLLERGVITMSLAPRDNHEAQVQFALERGIPAMLGVLSTQRLPYPSRAFDVAHCSRCLIPWTEFGGLFLLEVNRVLRPGGFWVLSGPPVNYETHWKGWGSTLEAQKADMDALEGLLASMCFTRHAAKGDLAVWRKAANNSCYKAREPLTYPPMCDDSVEPDTAWYTPMRACLDAIPEKENKPLAAWPQRLVAAPERVKYVQGGSTGAYKQDTQLWAERARHYKLVAPDLGTDRVRNVLDMNTRFGSLAAALAEDSVWVMNVVSTHAVNTLGVVYDRGLIGAVHDWCEAFSTYPRTYDMLHADGLFSEEAHRCELSTVMLEMDRILRPKGTIIVRDAPEALRRAAALGEAMRWRCQLHDDVALPGGGGGGGGTEGLLVCKKRYWHWKEEVQAADATQ